MRALLALGNGRGFKSRTSNDLRALRRGGKTIQDLIAVGGTGLRPVIFGVLAENIRSTILRDAELSRPEACATPSNWLLLGQAMERARAEHKINRVNADDGAVFE